MATRPTPSPDTRAPVRKRRGFPLLPTLMVAVAVPTLAGFGAWQLKRAHWKDALLAEYAVNMAAPLADLGDGPVPAGSQFKLVRLFVTCPAGLSEERAGRNLEGSTGYSHRVPCTAGGAPLILDAGWSARPDSLNLPAIAAGQEGRLVEDAAGGWILVARKAVPPLEASAPPSLETIPNNHLSYAVQWFSFATILAVIYGIWLRRWLAQRDTAA